jgi:hypothetical protein
VEVEILGWMEEVVEEEEPWKLEVVEEDCYGLLQVEVEEP